jgi:hypothetical protein
MTDSMTNSMSDSMTVQQFEVAVEFPLENSTGDFVMPASAEMEQHILKALSEQTSTASTEELLRWAISNVGTTENSQGKPIKRLTCLGATVHRQSN